MGTIFKGTAKVGPFFEMCNTFVEKNWLRRKKYAIYGAFVVSPECNTNFATREPRGPNHEICMA